MLLNRKFRTIVAFVTALCFSYNTYAASSAVVNSLYNYAHSKNVTKMRYMLNNLGYNVDTKDENGKTAYCIAKEKEDTCALNMLKQFGADPEQKCGTSWGLIAGVVGVAAAGGAIALASGGGGGCDGFKGDDGICYKKIKCLNGGKQYRDTCDCSTTKVVEGAQEYEGEFCEICTGVEKDGVCYTNISCNEPHGYQDGGVCVCDGANGYTGAFCTDCGVGFGHYGNPTVCYPTLACEHGAQEEDVCKCDTGWSGDLCNVCDEANGYYNFGVDGQCFKELECKAPGSNGTQSGNNCNCNEGYTGQLCDSCNTGYGSYGDEPNCHATLNCGDHGHQEGAVCKCDTGWSGDLCNVCDEANGYFEQDGTCYKQLDCKAPGSDGTQTGNNCNCNEGYTGQLCNSCESGYGNHGNAPYCYANIDCGIHGTQVRDACSCSDGWSGTYCDVCNGSEGADGVCYPTMDCGNGTQQGNTCICDPGYGRDGTGKCVAINPSPVKIVDTNDNYLYDDIDKIVKDYADVYGLVYASDPTNPSDHITGEQTDMYLSYLDGTSDANKISKNATLTILNLNDGNVYGMSSDANNIYLSYHAIASGVNVVSTEQSSVLTIQNGGNTDGFVTGGNGNAYGIYADGNGWTSGVGINLYSIAVDQKGTVGNMSIFSTINVTSIGSGDSYGMYSGRGNVNNGLYDVNTGTNTNTGKAVVNVTAKGTGNAYGLYAGGTGNVTNSGVVSVKSDSGSAVGIYASGGLVSNTYNINVETNSGTAYGIYADGGSVINSGYVTVSDRYGTSYGIYATNGATVNNTGTISVNGISYTGSGNTSYGNHIVLDGGAVLTNFGLVDYSGALDLDSFGGSVALGKNGVYSGESISGTLNVDSSVVTEGFKDKYVETSALKSSNVDVNAVSKSVMFEASVEKDADKESSSVVLNRKTFDELLGSTSVSKYLEANYQQGNNEQMYATLKKQESLSSFATAVSSELGTGLLPNFAQENMRVFKSLTNTLNDELFETSGKERSMVGYDYLYQERDSKGTLTGYENHSNTMYFMYDREHNNLLRSGFGMAITQFSSDYEDDSSREELMVQAMVPVSYVKDRGLSYASIARIGYGDGEYERVLSGDKYESDLTSWIYGLSNAVKYNMNLGFVEVEPVMELNVTGYYQDKIEETEGKRGSIKTEAENNMSVEAGLGLNLRKEVKFSQRSKLKLKAGAMYYHEYAHPYHSLHASQVGMSGNYLIRDEENIYDKDRGVINAGVDYEYKPFTIYGNFRQFIEEENPFEVNAGIKFNF